MGYASVLLAALLVPGDLGPGNHTRVVVSDCRPRSFIIYVPRGYNPNCPTPVVLALHGFTATGRMMMRYTDLNDKADQCGFIVVYPFGGPLAFNTGGVTFRHCTDDVAFIDRLLDKLPSMVNVDRCRVYACGLSNGGMMSYRLACQLSNRIAAIASVSGPMTKIDCCPCRPVPILHFHGTCDPEVPMDGPRKGDKSLIQFYSVPETMARWVTYNGCPTEPVVEAMPDRCPDCTTVTRTTWGPGCCCSEVVLYTICGGGHTWPGKKPPAKFLGAATYDIDATDIIWDFFVRHPMCCTCCPAELAPEPVVEP